MTSSTIINYLPLDLYIYSQWSEVGDKIFILETGDMLYNKNPPGINFKLKMKSK